LIIEKPLLKIEAAFSLYGDRENGNSPCHSFDGDFIEYPDCIDSQLVAERLIQRFLD